MADWDEDSPELRANLLRVLSNVRDDALRRAIPTSDTARKWHRDVMRGLVLPEPNRAGRFRGERGLRHLEVAVGDKPGVRSDQVADALKAFEEKLQEAVALLDGLIAPGQDLTADDVAAAIDLAAWAHAEWVRIHPFANGNGRTARLWANSIAMRYGLPPFVRLRPRPDDNYGAACAASMQGNWQPTARLFRQLYREASRLVT